MAAFLCDCATEELVACNQSFQSLLEESQEALLAEPRRWTSFLEPVEPDVFRQQTQSNLHGGEEWQHAQLIHREVERTPVRVMVKTIRWKQQTFFAAFIQDVSDELDREREWQRRVDEQKGRATTAISSSLRVYHLSEKIKWTPVITRDLLRLESEQDLFEHAAQLLTDEGGLNYREVTFLFLENNALNVAFSTRECDASAYRFDDVPQYRQFLERNVSIGESDEGVLLRLEMHDNLLGLCEVLPYEQEKAFFNGLGRISELQRDFLSALGDILSLLIANIRLSREIKWQSIIDPLTEVFNRRHFMERLHCEMERATRYERNISLIFIDLDRFKNINDDHGHLQGDQILKEIAVILAENFREADLVCRYGGDEFVVLLPETSAEEALAAGQKLVQSVSQHRFVDLKDATADFPVTGSVGVSTLSDGEDEDAFLHSADVALLNAKRLGKNQVASHSTSDLGAESGDE